tara:strand:+ start:2584 stop:3627 length:1044 start_codon:yes stop_codon:yes gene_type:complete
MLTNDFDYHLPEELIAQIPLIDRSASRLLIVNRTSNSLVHETFNNITEYLREGDVMVFNQSKVIPARFYGVRDDTNGKVEILLLRKVKHSIWQALARPGRRLRPGTSISILDKEGERSGIQIEVTESDMYGIKTIRMSNENYIDTLGHMPLPPYIHEKLEDPARYQTVYAKETGSVAAPTAGLHFSHNTMKDIENLGVLTAYVTLHVGLDTFRPVQEDNPMDHHIHTEYYEVDQPTAAILNNAKEENRRIIAVGTTSVRVLEQLGDNMIQSGSKIIEAASGDANIFILPGHKFKCVDAMVTNFHLPKSTLLMLVSAFASHNQIKQVYSEAIRQKYRFYSFGDAMFIT